MGAPLQAEREKWSWNSDSDDCTELKWMQYNPWNSEKSVLKCPTQRHLVTSGNENVAWEVANDHKITSWETLGNVFTCMHFTIAKHKFANTLNSPK